MAKTLSTFAIAQMLQVDPGSVANWIDQERLKAHRTPGGHRRVEVEDLMAFLRHHKMPVPPELRAAKACVLVVDDEAPVAEMIARAVSSSFPTCEVLQANDGFAAGTIVVSRKPRLVILDLRMPGLDGFEVCRRIRQHPDTRNTDVLAITAYPSPENVDRIKQCGAKACLPKPLEMEHLLKEVRAALV